MTRMFYDSETVFCTLISNENKAALEYICNLPRKLNLPYSCLLSTQHRTMWTEHENSTMMDSQSKAENEFNYFELIL